MGGPVTNIDMRHLCQHCGAEIPDKPYSSAMIFCSVACRSANYEALIRAATLASKEGRTCKECGGPIPAKRRAEAIYCSIKCNLRAGSRAAYARRRG